MDRRAEAGMSEPAPLQLPDAAPAETTATEASPRDRVGNALRAHAGDALRHLLGEDGYKSLQGRNWTLIGIVGPVIGIVADIVTVFGRAAFIGLLVSSALFIVFLLGAVLRTRFGRFCAFPCVLTLLLVVVFGFVVGAQRLATANEPDAANRGVLAATVPGIAQLQDTLIKIAAKLDRIEDTTDRIADTAVRTEAKADSIEAKLDRLLASETEKVALRTAIERLRQADNIRDRAILTFLNDVGETPLRPGQYPAQLARFAERYQSLLAEAEKPKNLPAQFEAMRQQAAEKIRTGALDEADALLASLQTRMAQWRREQQTALDQAKRDEANILSERADIASTRLRYRDAASLYREASELAASDPAASWRFRMDQTEALYKQGKEFGDNTALAEAIAVSRAALALVPRERVPLQWASAQNNLGTALSTLGDRESGTARLEEAVAAFRAALTERTHERVPLQWAATQHNLGATLQTLGRRENGTARLAEAVTAYRAALTERTRERVPLDWAATQNNLGNALLSLGERESGTARLEEAVAAFRAALTEWTRERVPLDWAMTQNNLGTVLASLGERESGTARLEEAVAAYRAALTERTRERVPYYWAHTQENLAIVFRSLATRANDEGRVAFLNEALAAVDDALEVYRAGNSAYDIGTAERLRARILAETQETQATPR
jgi:hypothetical protein